MAFGINTYGDLSPRVGIYAVANFLNHAEPVEVLAKFGMNEPLPKNKGQIVKWRRAVPLAVNTEALVEGVTPSPSQIQFETVTTQVSQYGNWVNFTDVIVDTHEDPILKNITQLLGEQAGATKEAIIWEELIGGTSVIYTGTATQRSEVDSPLTEDELIQAQRILKANRAKPITRMLKAGTAIATEPVAPGYIGFGHVNLEKDLRALPEFVVREKYSQYSPVSDWEIGKFQDLRFVLTPDLGILYGAGDNNTSGVLSRDGANVDVYPLVIVGQEAYGVTALRGMDSANVTVKNPESTYNDPLAQRGFASWKIWYVATRLNEEWMVRIETAVSA